MKAYLSAAVMVVSLFGQTAQAQDLATIIKACSARQEGGSCGGGGDPEGLGFPGLVASALSEIERNDPKVYTQLKAYKLDLVAREARVIFVDKVVGVSVENDLIQNSLAVNIPASNSQERDLILVNRTRWDGLSEVLKKGVALHEVLSLRKFEHTGYYPISSAYVSRLGSSQDREVLAESLHVDRLKQVQAITPGADAYETLKRFYEEAILPARLENIPRLVEKKTMKNPQLGPRDSQGQIPQRLEGLFTLANPAERLRCAFAGRPGANASPTSIYRIDLVVKGQPARGPLLPGSPDEIKGFFFFDRADHDLRIYSGSPLSNAFVNSRVFLRDRDLVAEELSDWSNKALYSTTMARVNNGMLAIKQTSIYNKRDGGSDPAYAYCYRER